MKRTLTVLAVLFACLGTLWAADYRIERVDTTITVGTDNVLSVSEAFSVYFNRPLHGIYRDIPVGYLDGQRVRVSDVRSSVECEVYETNRNYVRLRLGSENKVLTGEHRFTIGYRYDIGADRNEGYDELYYNLVGEGWEVTLEECSFKVVFPTDVDPQSVWVFRGSYGSRSSDGVNLSISGNTVSVKVGAMRPGETLTLKVELPDGYFVGARETVNRTPLYAGLTIASGLALLALAFVVWNRIGRDDVPVVVARFEPPQGMSPMQVGYLADGTVDDKDLTSMLFYWADKGLIKIEEDEKKKDHYCFEKLGEIGPDAPEMERYFFRSFFDCAKGGKVREKDLSNFYEKMMETKAKVTAYYTGERRLVETRSEVARILILFLGLIPAMLASLTLTWDYLDFGTLVIGAAGFVYAVLEFAVLNEVLKRWYVMKHPVAAVVAAYIPALFVIVVSALMCDFFVAGALQFVTVLLTVFILGTLAFVCAIIRKRSDYGQKVLEEVLGFREFLDKVEIDKLKMMIDSDPEVYYRNLSYAIVLGLEKKWASKFDGLAVRQPTWYDGHSRIMDAYFFSRMATHMTTNVQTAVMPKGSSSSAPGFRHGGSSFGGGGFSGGGFGGGGGGAW